MMAFLQQLEKWIDFFFAVIPRRRAKAIAAEKAHLIAHRGAHDAKLGIQENTDAAFKRAFDLGCWGIEFDVHACADEVLVINHDPTLQRLWKKDITIANVLFKDLHNIEPLLPTLEEVVAKYGKRMHFFIELKSPFVAIDSLIKTLQPLTPCVDYHLISLDENLLPSLHFFPKKSLLLVPVHNNVKSFFNLSLQENYGGILGHYLLLQNKQIEALQAVDQIAGVGFVDSKYGLYRELNRGLRFLFSNNVAEVGAYLQQLKKPPLKH